MSKSKVVSGTVISAESVITTFNNKDAYNALSEKVDLILTLDNNRTYQIDSPPEGIEIGSKVNLYCDDDNNGVIVDKMTAKHIKKKRFFEMMPNFALLASGGFGCSFLLVSLIIVTKREGLNYDMLSTLIFSSLLMVFLFFIGSKGADKVVHPEDLKKIDALLKESIEDESFISPEDIEKVKSTHKKKVNV